MSGDNGATLIQSMRRQAHGVALVLRYRPSNKSLIRWLLSKAYWVCFAYETTHADGREILINAQDCVFFDWWKLPYPSAMAQQFRQRFQTSEQPIRRISVIAFSRIPKRFAMLLMELKQ